MSVIIRLQRLPWTASAADVRDFFHGLVIPEGGVHIVGGKEGDAFIAFASDEDARQAMQMDGKKIKDNRVKLLLSSRMEMQKIIEKARTDYVSAGTAPQSGTSGVLSTATKPSSRSRSRERHRRSPSGSPNRLDGGRLSSSQRRGGNKRSSRSRSRSPLRDHLKKQQQLHSAVGISASGSYPAGMHQQFSEFERTAVVKAAADAAGAKSSESSKPYMAYIASTPHYTNRHDFVQQNVAVSDGSDYPHQPYQASFVDSSRQKLGNSYSSGSSNAAAAAPVYHANLRASSQHPSTDRFEGSMLSGTTAKNFAESEGIPGEFDRGGYRAAIDTRQQREDRFSTASIGGYNAFESERKQDFAGYQGSLKEKPNIAAGYSGSIDVHKPPPFVGYKSDGGIDEGFGKKPSQTSYSGQFEYSGNSEHAAAAHRFGYNAAIDSNFNRGSNGSNLGSGGELNAQTSSNYYTSKMDTQTGYAGMPQHGYGDPQTGYAGMPQHGYGDTQPEYAGIMPQHGYGINEKMAATGQGQMRSTRSPEQPSFSTNLSYERMLTSDRGDVVDNRFSEMGMLGSAGKNVMGAQSKEYSYVPRAKRTLLPTPPMMQQQVALLPTPSTRQNQKLGSLYSSEKRFTSGSSQAMLDRGDDSSHNTSGSNLPTPVQLPSVLNDFDSRKSSLGAVPPLASSTKVVDPWMPGRAPSGIGPSPSTMSSTATSPAVKRALLNTPPSGQHGGVLSPSTRIKQLPSLLSTAPVGDGRGGRLSDDGISVSKLGSSSGGSSGHGKFCTKFVKVPERLLRYSLLKDELKPITLRGNDRIKIIYDPMTRKKTGDVYIRFNNTKDCEECVQRWRTRLNIQSQLCDEKEFNCAVDGPPPNVGGDFRSKSPDGGYQKQTGGKKASPSLDFSGTSSRAGKGSSVDKQRDRIDDDYEYFIICLDNVAYKAERRDVKDFLGNIKAAMVEIEKSARSRLATGRVFVQLENKEDMIALEKMIDKKLRGRAIKIRRSTAREMERCTGIVPKKISTLRSAGGSRSKENGETMVDNGGTGAMLIDLSASLSTAASPLIADSDIRLTDTCVQVTNLSSSVSEREIADFFAEFSVVPNGIRVMKEPIGSAYVEFADANECAKAQISKHRQYLGLRCVEIRCCPRQQMRDDVLRQFSIFDDYFAPASALISALAAENSTTSTARSDKSQSSSTTDVPVIDPAVAATVGNPNCVLALHNLPSNVTVDHLYTFFSGYDIVDESIRMHYTRAGTPTGSALLALATPEQATQAVKSLHKRALPNSPRNPITVSLVPF